jgi:hypothetical protein
MLQCRITTVVLGAWIVLAMLSVTGAAATLGLATLSD